MGATDGCYVHICTFRWMVATLQSSFLGEPSDLCRVEVCRFVYRIDVNPIAESPYLSKRRLRGPDPRGRRIFRGIQTASREER